MKRIYLVRHAQPELGGREHVCLGGRSDVPLSELGMTQAAAMAKCFDSKREYSVYASPMIRARQTAELISAGRWEVKILPGMEEMDCGEWDGLSFDVIRERYPELYARRGGDLSLTPPGAESLLHCAERGRTALEKLWDDPAEDIILVAHKGMNRALICLLMGRDVSEYRGLKQDYVSVNVICAHEGKYEVKSIGQDGLAAPDAEEWYARFSTPENIREHCAAVRDAALALTARLEGIDAQLLSSAALLHDMCRHMRQHETLAAESLENAGYLAAARIVSAHGDCSADGELDEAKLLYLADKLCIGAQRVSLEERFEQSCRRCTTPEALMHHDRRKAAAEEIMKKYCAAVSCRSLEEVFAI